MTLAGATNYDGGGGGPLAAPSWKELLFIIGLQAKVHKEKDKERKKEN